MTDTFVLDRIEARLDRQAQRIDVLYAVLEERGLLPLHRDAGDALLDELAKIEDGRAPRRGGRLLHLGSATGV